MERGDRKLRAAQLAHVLSRAVRAGEVEYSDARRVIVHELRRLNTNKKLQIRPRSVEAQRVVSQYGQDHVPKNGSPDALHADHYRGITPDTFVRVTTADGWLEELELLAKSVVCVTARENYLLERVEATGVNGPEKYAAAGVIFDNETPWDERY